MIRSKEASSPYFWGDLCKGWHLVNAPQLSVIQELMPPGTGEVMHRHLKAQQFFYILKGTATFIIEGKEWNVEEGKGVHIQQGELHMIQNKTPYELEFLVISQPHAHGDRDLVKT